MARAGVSYQEVEGAAQQIVANGYEPTVERVRGLLKTGSNSTLSNHLRTWRKKKEVEQQILLKDKIPEELIRLLKGLWDRTLNEADHKITIIKQECQEEIEQYKRDIQVLEQNNVRLQQSVLQLTEIKELLEREKKEFEDKLNSSHTEIASLQAKNQGLLELGLDRQEQLEELKTQNRQIQANFEHYQSVSLEQRQLDQQRTQQVQRELAQLTQQYQLELEMLKTQKVNLQISYEQLQYIEQTTQAELKEISEQFDSASKALDQIKIDLLQKEISQQHWQTQFENFHAKWEIDIKLISDLQARNQILSDKIQETNFKTSETIEQCKILEKEKLLLIDENTKLKALLICEEK